MPIRKKHKVGDWLVEDDESGIVRYRSQMVERWDGLWVRHDQYETRQPQEFVKAKTDPKAVSPIRPEKFVRKVDNTIPYRIGNTDVLTPTNGPAAHLFAISFKIGPTGIPSTNVIGNVDFNPTGSSLIEMSAAGIQSGAGFGALVQIQEIADGAGGIGIWEIRNTFEVS